MVGCSLLVCRRAQHVTAQLARRAAATADAEAYLQLSARAATKVRPVHFHAQCPHSFKQGSSRNNHSPHQHDDAAACASVACSPARTSVPPVSAGLPMPVHMYAAAAHALTHTCMLIRACPYSWPRTPSSAGTGGALWRNTKQPTIIRALSCTPAAAVQAVALGAKAPGAA